MTQFLKHNPLLSLALCLGLATLTGCTVGPNYKRPTIEVPDEYRAPASLSTGGLTSHSGSKQPSDGISAGDKKAADKSTVSLGDEDWSKVFQDPELQRLIRTALKNNYDVRIAAARVLQAQAQLGITRADQYPSLGAGGNITSQNSPQSGPIPSYEVTQGQLTASAARNLDFWGKYRRATEAARATLLANEWAQREVRTTLVANLATAYFQLRELDLELEISQRTFNSRTQSLQLTQTLEQHGINSLLDVRQSEQLVYTAATKSRISNGRSHSRRMPSAFCWEIIQEIFLAGSN